MSPVCDSLTLWTEVGTSRALCGFFCGHSELFWLKISHRNLKSTNLSRLKDRLFLRKGHAGRTVYSRYA